MSFYKSYWSAFKIITRQFVTCQIKNEDTEYLGLLILNPEKKSDFLSSKKYENSDHVSNMTSYMILSG